MSTGKSECEGDIMRKVLAHLFHLPPAALGFHRSLNRKPALTSATRLALKLASFGARRLRRRYIMIQTLRLLPYNQCRARRRVFVRSLARCGQWPADSGQLMMTIISKASEVRLLPNVCACHCIHAYECLCAGDEAHAFQIPQHLRSHLCARAFGRFVRQHIDKHTQARQ